MAQTALITGTGRPHALGFNLVKRYLENGDRVLASIRRPSEALEELRKDYEHAETLRRLFEERRHDEEGPVFITYEGEPYPW